MFDARHARCETRCEKKREREKRGSSSFRAENRTSKFGRSGPEKPIGRNGVPPTYPDAGRERSRIHGKGHLPSSRSLTSLAARSPSARRSLSIFLDRSAASFSPVVLTAQPIPRPRRWQSSQYVVVTVMMMMVDDDGNRRRGPVVVDRSLTHTDLATPCDVFHTTVQFKQSPPLTAAAASWHLLHRRCRVGTARTRSRSHTRTREPDKFTTHTQNTRECVHTYGTFTNVLSVAHAAARKRSRGVAFPARRRPHEETRSSNET